MTASARRGSSLPRLCGGFCIRSGGRADASLSREAASLRDTCRLGVGGIELAHWDFGDSGVRNGGVIERLAVVARLLPGSRERAAEIIAEGPPYGLQLAGFRRHSVFLAEEAVVFVFEGQGIEGLVRDLVNDPARSASFSAWAPLLEGTPVLAREEFHWEAGHPQ
jgi:hypothetical protein